MRFKSKIDLWLALLVFGSLFFTLGLIAIVVPFRAVRDRPEAMIPFAFIAVVVLFLVHLFRTTDYQIDGPELLIRSGLFRWRVEIHAIELVQRTRNPLSSPALSLDRLSIHYRKNGVNDQILVSPLDREGFVAALRQENPLIIATDRLAR